MAVCADAYVTEQSTMIWINVRHLQQSIFQSGSNETPQQMTLEKLEGPHQQSPFD